MSSSGFGMNGNGNGQFPSGQGIQTPYPTWMSVNNNNHVNFFMYGNGGPAPPGGIPAPGAQPHLEPPTGHWPYSSMGQIHQPQTPIPAYGMPHHGQVNPSWSVHNAQSAFQGLPNPGIPGDYSSGQFGSNGVNTRLIMVVPTSALFDKLKDMDGNGGQGGGGMGGFGGSAGAGSFGF